MRIVLCSTSASSPRPSPRVLSALSPRRTFRNLNRVHGTRSICASSGQEISTRIISGPRGYGRAAHVSQRSIIHGWTHNIVSRLENISYGWFLSNTSAKICFFYVFLVPNIDIKINNKPQNLLNLHRFAWKSGGSKVGIAQNIDEPYCDTCFSSGSGYFVGFSGCQKRPPE